MAIVLVLLLTSKIFADVYVYKDKDGVMTFTNVPCTVEQLQTGCARVEKVRQWQWKWDTNYDGNVTISDVSGWVKWLFYYPGDWLIYSLLEEKGNKKTAEFFELTPASYGGWGSFFVSLVAWWSLLVGLAEFPDEIGKDVDKFKGQISRWREWYRIKFKSS